MGMSCICLFYFPYSDLQVLNLLQPVLVPDSSLFLIVQNLGF